MTPIPTYPEIVGTGYSIPAGSLDRWFDGRGNAASRLVAFAEIGDSTMAGATTTGVTNYSPISRLRQRLITDGYLDGGHGNLNGPNDDLGAGEGLVRAQGFNQTNAFTVPGESEFSDVAGDDQTFTRIGRYLTLWYDRFNTAGRFTYEIDSSGTEIVIDPAYPSGTGVYNFARTALIDMGADGTHTIRVRNKGGRLLTAPTGSSVGGITGSGTLPVGSYDYAAAFVTPGGQIGPLGVTTTIAITSVGQAYSFSLVAQPAAAGTTTNLYRRPAGSGSFKLIGSATTNSGSPYLVCADTGLTDTTVHVADATPLNSASKFVNVATIVTKAAGIVLHNFAVRGSTSATAANPYNEAIILGLDLEPGSAVAATSRAIDTSPGAIRPVLTMLSHGINDQQGSTSDNSPTLHDNTVTAIQAARHAGSDVVVTIPAFELATNQDKAPLYRAALKAAAEEQGAGWIDIGMGGALPGAVAGVTTNPHLDQAQYDTQADFIWDNVLGATLTPTPTDWESVVAERWDGSSWSPVVAEEWDGTAWAPAVLERAT